MDSLAIDSLVLAIYMYMYGPTLETLEKFKVVYGILWISHTHAVFEYNYIEMHEVHKNIVSDNLQRQH